MKYPKYYDDQQKQKARDAVWKTAIKYLYGY